MKPNKRRLVLGIVATDRTFSRSDVRGRPAWVGRCLHCSRRLVVDLDGEPLGAATIEHVVPRSWGGTDAPENLALACDRCNQGKGARHDVAGDGDERARSVVEALARKRRERWREPARTEDAPGP